MISQRLIVHTPDQVQAFTASPDYEIKNIWRVERFSNTMYKCGPNHLYKIRYHVIPLARRWAAIIVDYYGDIWTPELIGLDYYHAANLHTSLSRIDRTERGMYDLIGKLEDVKSGELVGELYTDPNLIIFQFKDCVPVALRLSDIEKLAKLHTPKD
jgi:hypothetical protein